jgi:hypothetical protein
MSINMPTLTRIKSTSLTKAAGTTALVVALFAAASPTLSGNDLCHDVTGKAVWTLVPSADPLGRFVGPTKGTLKAAATGALLSLAPNPDGSLHATSDNVWVVGSQDVIRFAGDATFTPLAGEPIGTVSDSETLTVTGGSGRYAGATGTITVTGIGYNLFGPNAGPGSTYFDLRYAGTVCRAN